MIIQNNCVCSCCVLLFPSLQVYEFAVKEVLIHRVPLVDGGISPQKKKRKHRHDDTIFNINTKTAFGVNFSRTYPPENKHGFVCFMMQVMGKDST